MERPTRVNLFMETFPAHSETWNWSVAQGLVDRNYDVSVVAVNEGNWSIIGGRQAFSGKAYFPKTAFRRIKSFKLRYGLNLVKDMGSFFVRSPRIAWRMLGQYPLHAVKGATALWTHTFTKNALPPDAINHGLFGLSARRALMLRSATLISGPVVATFGGFDINVVGEREGPEYYRELFAKVDRIIAVSDFIRRRLISRGAPAERIDVVYYGVNLEKFRFRPPQARGIVTRFIMVGRLTECKGVSYAIRAFQQLRKTHSNIELVIVGDGELREKLHATAQKNGADGIRFTGMISHDAVQKELHEADILLAPGVVGSDGAEEALGGSVIEAHAVGLPVITTNVGGLTEAMVPDLSGLVVKPNDAGALRDAMQYMTENPKRWAAMSEAGRAHVEEYFSANGYLDRLERVYERAWTHYKS